MLSSRTSYRLIPCVALLVAAVLPITGNAGPRRRGGDPKTTKQDQAQTPPKTEASEKETAREQASALMRQGTKALQEGRYLDALNLFKQAYDLVPSVKLDFNLGQVYYELGRPVEALHHYERFVTEMKRTEAPEQWKIAYERAFKLRGTIGTLDIQTNVPGALITIDGNPIGETPLLKPVRLLPGSHTILVTKEGYERQVIQLELQPGQSTSRLVQLLTEEEALARQRIVRQLAEQQRAANERLRRAYEEAKRTRDIRSRRLKGFGWASLGLGASAMAAAGVLLSLSTYHGSKIRNAQPGQTYWLQVSDAYDKSSSYNFVGLITLGAASALSVGGIVLVGLGRWIAGRPLPPAPKGLTIGAPVPMGTTQAIGMVVAGNF